ncbi:hypothetical protein EVAR_81499_1 [Eumeta japonica]|uniref:Uncharacterized protein n=1 Tax=Eumeta variegata TaxID=151549 RepID=A0A4C1W0Y4_EUMVA|nr:hypothetical protein EVAR_81499_1 [Eumeta japonica]
MGRPTKRAAHRSHPYCKPLRSSIDHHIRLRQLLDHNDVTVEITYLTLKSEGLQPLRSAQIQPPPPCPSFTPPWPVQASNQMLQFNCSTNKPAPGVFAPPIV